MVGAPAPRGRIELLAPAGERRALRAALSAGADAVYFGLDRWSARASAGNFAGETVLEAIELAHLHDARAYLALNTLLKDDEIGPALAALEAPYFAGLDALIVADLGFIPMVRREYPDLALHASTQLNTHSSQQLMALARLGCRRAVLARELSLDEIAALDRHGLELEAFVHGALCYGYSGDCLLSSMIGGRSGNRGRCSQACRLRYELAVGATGATPADRGRSGAGVRREPDRRQSPRPEAARSDPGSGDPRPRGAQSAGGHDRAAANAEAAGSRLMSTCDLAAIGLLPQLVAAGVTSLKIEGRMKDAGYVGVTTAVYREALDAALADPQGYRVRPEWLARLEQSFSRTFTAAHLEGRHYAVRSGGRSGHRGVLVGRVARVDEASGDVDVRLSRPVAAGDLVSFYTGWGQTEPVRLPEGGDERLTLRVRERVAVKDRLFRLAAAAADELVQDLVTGRTVVRPLGVRMCFSARAGEPARLTVAAQATDARVTVQSAAPLAPARTAGLTLERVRDALSALGGTPYRLADLDVDLADGLFMPVGELKELRRRALAELDARRLAAHRRSPAALTRREAPAPAAAGRRRPARVPQTIVCLRPGEAPLTAPGIGTLCLDLLRDDPLPQIVAAVEALRASGLPLRVRLPEVLFDGDELWWRALLALPWQGIYARHLGLVAALADTPALPFVLESPLQGLNSLATDVAAELAGRRPEALVASPEAALAEIAALAPGTAVEVLAFGRQQVLHTRDQLGRAEALYAPPAAAGHVALTLTDAKGYEFPATVDTDGTRLFNARVTNLAANLDELAEAGVGGFLVVQSDLSDGERAAFRRGGLPALAPLASRERSTTGHLFRGVA